MYKIVRSEDEVDGLLHECIDAVGTGRSRLRGKTYEQGIQDAIMWLIHTLVPNPLED